MTAICGGGTSSPKLGYAEFVQYTSALLSGIMGVYNVRWLIPVIPLLQLAPLELDVFCATDPPAEPSFTSAETNAMLQLQFGADFDSGLSKFRDLLLSMLWRELCDCDSGTPAAFTPPTIPTGTPITQTPLDRTVVPCQTYDHVGSHLNSSGDYVFDLPTMAGRGISYAVMSGDSGAVSSPNSVTYSLRFLNGIGANLGTISFSIDAASPGPKTVSTGVPLGTEQLELRLHAAGTVGVSQPFDAHIDAYCGGDLPGGTGNACCLPDLTLQSTSDAILRLVTLIQRQIAPFAYIDGAAHSALTDSGEITLSGVIGARIDLTTIPDRAGRASGDPLEFFSIGWFAWGDSTGFAAREFVSHDGQLSLPAQAGVFTRLGYSLAPDVVATITELIREP